MNKSRKQSKSFKQLNNIQAHLPNNDEPHSTKKLLNKYESKSFLSRQHESDSISEENSINNRVNNYLDEMYSVVSDDYKSKREYRRWMMIAFTIYFFVVTGIILWIALSSRFNYIDDNIKDVLLGGFFLHLVALLAIIFRYAFSSSSYYYKFVIGLFKSVKGLSKKK